MNLGGIFLEPLSHLQPLGQSSSKIHPSLTDLNDEDGDSWRPSFAATCRVFPLNYCSTCGHTCLVYKITSQGACSYTDTVHTHSHIPLTRIHTHTATPASECSIWLLDLSTTWHPLSPSFSDYLRLAMVHLGLHQWPYALTPNQLSPQYEVIHTHLCTR